MRIVHKQQELRCLNGGMNYFLLMHVSWNVLEVLMLTMRKENVYGEIPAHGLIWELLTLKRKHVDVLATPIWLKIKTKVIHNGDVNVKMIHLFS